MYDLIFIYEFKGDLKPFLQFVIDEDYLGFWKEGEYSFLFFKREKKPLRQKLPLPFRSELVIRHEDWEAGQPFHSFQVGRIIVYPPWLIPPSLEGIKICLDPRMAFGSGFHASTRGCLHLLEKLFQSEAPQIILDLGTGTGILSLAGLKLGAQKSFALDYNNLAIETARLNRKLNSLEDKMHLWQGDARDFLYIKCDLLIANMPWEVIAQITEKEIFFTKRYYLISGLLGNESYRLTQKLKEKLILIDQYEENFWFSFLYQRK
ncbi:MAG: 50S ribosomal protein L11 methyltransferase [Thermodesulfobacteriota bacterium]